MKFMSDREKHKTKIHLSRGPILHNAITIDEFTNGIKFRGKDFIFQML